MTSVFEIFKIGLGPSSSHTTGPMVAAHRFRGVVPAGTTRLTAELFGSLAWTGKGHGTDRAICLGLLGHEPSELAPDAVDGHIAGLHAAKAIVLPSGARAAFNPDTDLIWDYEKTFPSHSNAMRFRALDAAGSVVAEKVYYSIGGGFVREDGEAVEKAAQAVPYDFANAAALLQMCEGKNLSIAEIQFANEAALKPTGDVERDLDRIAQAMFDCIDRGLATEGCLPGALKVKRRAKTLMEKLQGGKLRNQAHPHEIMDWVSTYAIAVNEENAAGGRVVTAPTNGAAGIIPAVLRYYRDFYPDATPENVRTFLLSAAAVGAIIKRNASISGAEVGCQGEVGSAASMAAAGLTAVLGGTPEQVENAAEIAMEHHLGMTCDPIGGLVQIPCIERNAFGANKAIAAASLALRGDGSHRVSFDQVIETMRQTGSDMQSKYKETSQGGLAVNVPEC